MAGIFISYRREDTAPYAGRLFDRLSREFSDDQVFMDIDNIEPGDDFVQVIDERLATCNVVIALIGREWLRCKEKSGQRRLDSPDDFVRMELARALACKIRVIPVLVGDAGMPASNDLPDDLKRLGSRHAIELSDARFHSDVGPLIERIRKDLVAAAPAASPAMHGAAVPAAVAAPAPADLPAAPSMAPAPATPELPRAPAIAATPARARKWGRWVIPVMLLILIAVLYSSGGREVVVPDLYKLPIAKARETLISIGLVPGQVKTSEVDNVDAGAVVGQQPGMGEKVRSGTVVDLVVAEPVGKGTEVGGGIEITPSLLLPDVRGKGLDEAKKALAGAGARTGRVETRKVADSRSGSVIQQRPAAGERVEPGSVVDLVVAAAPDVIVPDLAKLPVAKAKIALEVLSLGIGVVSGAPGGQVADHLVVRSQTPAAGAALRAGGRVDLVVAEPLMVVPGLVKLPLDRARQLLERQGLVVGSVSERAIRGAEAGVVLEQAVAAGRGLSKGSSVDLVVAAKSATTASVAMPNWVATTLLTARDWARRQGIRDVIVKPNYDKKGPAGWVTSQYPPPGTIVSADSTVEFEVTVVPRWIELVGRSSDASAAKRQADSECANACVGAGGKWSGKFTLKESVLCACDIFGPAPGATSK